MANILIVDDKRSMRKMLFESLVGLGYRVDQAEDGMEAWSMIEKREYDLIVSDIKMPDLTGIELLEKIRESGRDCRVILMTAFGEVETVIKAMRLGVFDFIIKPFSLDSMEQTIQKAIKSKINEQDNKFLKEEIKKNYDFSSIIGESPQMLEIFELIKLVAPSKTNILIMGESGTGKELIASSIHYHSNRRERPFVKLNCGALSTNLIESELFGHVKGAFTGAIKDKQGRFALADNGSIFLDEIGEVEASTQVKLLRIIQEGEYEKVGSDRTGRVDVRLISATNKDLKQEIKNKNFREDLYYRLNVISINLPPLRERGKDILLISDYFMKKYAAEYGKMIDKIDDDVKEYFLRYNWPGNVRELQNVLERAVVLCGGNSISLTLIPQDIKEANISENYIKHGGKTLTEIVEEVEKSIIFDSLNINNWVQTHTAEKLGITRSALQYKMQKYDLYKKEREN